jgi:hypothetical protein
MGLENSIRAIYTLYMKAPNVTKLPAIVLIESIPWQWPPPSPAYSGDFEKYLKDEIAAHNISSNNNHEKKKPSEKKKARTAEEVKFYREYHSGYI